VKVKFTLKRAMKAHMGSKCIAVLCSLTSVLDGGGWSTPRHGRFTPGKRPGTDCKGGEYICALLGYCATSRGNCLTTFRDNMSVPSSRVKILSSNLDP
jgi:hypothetical protein